MTPKLIKTVNIFAYLSAALSQASGVSTAGSLSVVRSIELRDSSSPVGEFGDDSVLILRPAEVFFVLLLRTMVSDPDSTTDLCE